jgi:hypothetical protein
MANWLDKYEQGGMVLKKKTKDNYGKKANPNDVKASVGPDFVGLGYNTKGRDYSPAWGGQFQNGGKAYKSKPMAQSSDIKSASNTFNADDFSNYSTIINKYPNMSNDTSYMYARNTPTGTEQFFHNTNQGKPVSQLQRGNEFVNLSPEQVNAYKQKVLTGTGGFAMGGALPGAVGFTYARVAGSAPANGKYTKKTKASAQNGKEMAFYQNGLDFKPKSISKNGSVIKDDRGQWAYPGEVTEIGSNNITMQGVDYPVLGVSDTGDTQMMQPNQDYKFDGEKVTEYPMMQEGGWLDKYPEPMRQDATRVAPPVLKLTEREKLENAAKYDQGQKKALVNAKEELAERKKNKATKGDLNTPGSWHTEDKARLSNILPASWAPPGGAVDVFDEYINPATYVGVLTDALGESVAARDPKGIATSLALAAGTGALGIDPLGSALKVPGKVAQSMKSGLLSNAYKVNPLAFKPNSEAYYRMIGEGGYADALESGVVRPPVGSGHTEAYYNKGYPLDTRLRDATGRSGYGGPYMAEVKGNPELFVDENVANYTGPMFDDPVVYSKEPISISNPNVKLYKENWLKGYKEVPKPTSTQRVTRGPINYWEEPGFAKRNPNFNPEAYANSPVGNLSASRDIPKGMEPRLSKNENGGWLNKYK